MQTLQDNREKMIAGEGVPQRRAADTPLAWVEEGPHATLMTPECVLAILGFFPNGEHLAQHLAERVEIEVRRALAGEQAELLDVVRMLAAVAKSLNKPAGARDRIDPLGELVPLEPWHPLHTSGTLVQAAQRLCLRHGYSETGEVLTGEPPALNPEMMIERVEQGQRDFGHTYRWLRSEAKRAGFNYICEAIAFAAAKKGGA